MRNQIKHMRHGFYLRWCLLSCFILAGLNLFGQDPLRTITGRVDDEKGGRFMGATVKVKGRNVGTSTGANGAFSLQATSTDTLTVSSIGYEPVSVPVGTNSFLRITLRPSVNTLSDVVVVGYGTVRRADLTGSVTQVSTKDLTKLPAANLSQALQGNVPGLWTNQSDRSPGAGINIALRGNNSFSGNSPLFIVDGFPMASGGGINSINPNDIESVSVLKDASSVAIYGARAANGVILITTKSGKMGKNNFSINAYTSFKSFSNPIEFISGNELAELRKEAYKNDNVNGGMAVFRPEEIAQLESGNTTNWWNEITGSGRPTQSLQMMFTGGNENTKVLVSGNLYNEKGIVNNSDFIRGNIRVNVNQKLGKLNLTSNNNIAVISGRSVSGPSILYPAMIGNPLAPIRQPSGSYYTMLIGVGNSPWANPVAFTNELKNRYTEPVITSSLALEYTVISGLKLKTQLSGEMDSWKQNAYVPIALSANHEESGRVSDGFANVTNNVNYNWISETTASYIQTFNDLHRVEAVAGFSVQENRWETVNASASGFAFDLYETWNLGASSGQPRKPYSDLQRWAMNSYIGRVNYTYNDRYILTGTVRADGSSRFGANNKWGVFPSVAAAWKISEESLIKDLDIFDEFKLRGSYGLAGNANALGVYSTQARLSPASSNFGGVEATGYYPSQLAYDNLKWETTKQLDFGLDMSMLKRRLQFSLDYYIKNTKDLIRQLPILAISGFQSGWANLGNLKNTGVELALKGLIVDSELKWNTTLNLAANANKLTSLGDGTQQIGTSHWVGQPIGIGARYMIEKIGIWQTEEKEEAAVYGSKPGDVKYRDVNNDKKINNEDRAFHGRLTPTFYGSLTNDLTYKGFDFNVFLTFEKGRYVYNGLNYKLLAGDGYDNHRREILDRWTLESPSNTNPRAALGYANRSTMSSTEFLEKADFIKVKSITLGYTLSEKLTVHLKNVGLRAYLSVVNPFIITDYSGMDPEDSDYGNTDRYAPYPITKSFSIGLNLNF